jgi:hypothetical protein
MPFEEFTDIDTIIDARRKAVAKSLRIMNLEDLKKLSDEIFDSRDHPWRQKLFELIRENPRATFTTPMRAKACSFSTIKPTIKGCGICTIAEWDLCPRPAAKS